MHTLAARLGGAVSRRLFNVAITNVPGPQHPLFVAGAQMASTYPVMPLGPVQGALDRADVLRRRGLLRALRRPGRPARRRRPRPVDRRRPAGAARGPPLPELAERNPPCPWSVSTSRSTRPPLDGPAPTRRGRTRARARPTPPSSRPARPGLGNDDEEREYAAWSAAAVRRRRPCAGQGGRRVVASADVDAAVVRRAERPTRRAVELDAVVALSRIASFHIDEQPGGDVADLLWYDVTELDDVIALLAAAPSVRGQPASATASCDHGNDPDPHGIEEDTDGRCDPRPRPDQRAGPRLRAGQPRAGRARGGARRGRQHHVGPAAHHRRQARRGSRQEDRRSASRTPTPRSSAPSATPPRPTRAPPSTRPTPPLRRGATCPSTTAPPSCSRPPTCSPVPTAPRSTPRRCWDRARRHTRPRSTRLRAHRLLALQRALRPPDPRGAAPGQRSRHLEPHRLPLARGLRLRDHAVQLHRHRGQPPDRTGAHGQHGRVEGVAHPAARGPVRPRDPRGGRHAAGRHQPRERPRHRGLRRRPQAPRVRRPALHRLDPRLPAAVAGDRRQPHDLPPLPAHRR